MMTNKHRARPRKRIPGEMIRVTASMPRCLYVRLQRRALRNCRSVSGEMGAVLREALENPNGKGVSHGD